MSLFFAPSQTASSLMPFMGSVDSPARSAPTGAMPVDSRKELTFSAWTNIMKKSRWLGSNAGIFKRFLKATSRYTVGSGICPIPDTGNRDFDNRLEDYFCSWADAKGLVDVYDRHTWWQMQRKILQAWPRDGDHFVLKVPQPDFVSTAGIRVPGLPRLQRIESHLIGPSLASGAHDGHESDGFAWGIQYGDFRPINYKVRTDRTNQRDLSGTQTIAADRMLWLTDPDRVGEYRGVPWLHHGLNPLIDVMDLNALEKHAQKLHSGVAGSIRRKLPTPTKGATGTVSLDKKLDKNGKTRVVAFENFLAGAGILQLGLDEEFTLQSSTRQTDMFVGLINHLVRDVCAGFDTTPEFFWSVADLNGPAARMVLEDAQSMFESLQDLLVTQFCIPTYFWVVARGVERGELIIPPGVNPFGVHWQGPAKITIDQGREGELELARLASGCGTWAEYWNKRGKSGRKQVYARIDELADAMEYAANKKGPGHEQGVPFDYIMALNKGGDGNADKKQDQKQDPKADPKKPAN